LKLKARIKKIGNNLVMIMPKSAIWVTGLHDGDVLEIDIKDENMFVARKLDNIQYIDTKDMDLYGKQVVLVTKEPLIT
jgi:antitoxin component of MazEF toxin-antitoxin module